MTTTPLPSYGIWTTDENGQRVMGFTPEQFLSVWQARADLEAEIARLRATLLDIAQASPDQNAVICARAALEKQP